MEMIVYYIHSRPLTHLRCGHWSKMGCDSVHFRDPSTGLCLKCSLVCLPKYGSDIHCASLCPEFYSYMHDLWIDVPSPVSLGDALFALVGLNMLTMGCLMLVLIAVILISLYFIKKYIIRKKDVKKYGGGSGQGVSIGQLGKVVDCHSENQERAGLQHDIDANTSGSYDFRSDECLQL